ncbi:calcium binding EGF domain protein, partial [Teladorsagia circumcincta]
CCKFADILLPDAIRKNVLKVRYRIPSRMLTNARLTLAARQKNALTRLARFVVSREVISARPATKSTQTPDSVTTKRCEDVDECEKFAGHVCDLSAECKNTIGSFVCKCKKGFKLAEDGRRCEAYKQQLSHAVLHIMR